MEEGDRGMVWWRSGVVGGEGGGGSWGGWRQWGNSVSPKCFSKHPALGLVTRETSGSRRMLTHGRTLVSRHTHAQTHAHP